MAECIEQCAVFHPGVALPEAGRFLPLLLKIVLQPQSICRLAQQLLLHFPDLHTKATVIGHTSL